MRLNEVNYSDAKPFEGYGPGFFRIGGKVVHGAMLAHAGGVDAWGGLTRRLCLRSKARLM